MIQVWKKTQFFAIFSSEYFNERLEKNIASSFGGTKPKTIVFRFGPFDLCTFTFRDIQTQKGEDENAKLRRRE